MITKPRRTLAIVLASAAMCPAAASQSPALGSTSPSVVAGDTTGAKRDSTAKPEFKPSWSFGVWLFGAYTYQTDSATRAVNNGNATSQFSVDRAYLTFRGQVAPDFGFRVTTDIKALPANNTTYNGLIVRLKYAYLQWDYLHAADSNSVAAWARIGQIHTVVLEDEERFWPRWLQKTALEYWALQPGAADQGASTQLTLPQKWGWAYFTIGNGGGYQTAIDADRYKDVALRLSLTPLGKSTGFFKTFEIAPWGQIGRSQGGVVNNPGLENNAGGIFIGNSDPRLTFGAEFAERQFQTLPTGATVPVTTTGRVWDGFLIVRPSLFSDPRATPWGLIVRYDDFQASSATSAYRSLLLAGAFIDVARSTSFALTYQDDEPQSGNSLPAKTIWQLNWQLTF